MSELAEPWWVWSHHRSKCLLLGWLWRLLLLIALELLVLLLDLTLEHRRLVHCRCRCHPAVTSRSDSLNWRRGRGHVRSPCHHWCACGRGLWR